MSATVAEAETSKTKEMTKESTKETRAELRKCPGGFSRVPTTLCMRRFLDNLERNGEICEEVAELEAYEKQDNAWAMRRQRDCDLRCRE